LVIDGFFGVEKYPCNGVSLNMGVVRCISGNASISINKPNMIFLNHFILKPKVNEWVET
jgi:hypothetical protein